MFRFLSLAFISVLGCQPSLEYAKIERIRCEEASHLPVYYVGEPGKSEVIYFTTRNWEYDQDFIIFKRVGNK